MHTGHETDASRHEMTRKNKPRAPRTREMLLPLAAIVVRDVSLENHLSLAAMRAGHGTLETVIALLRILYMTYFLLENAHTEIELALFIEVEAALERSIRAAEQGQEWQLSAEGLSGLERILLRCDEMIGSLPKYRYVDAWNKLQRFVQSPSRSPLPGSLLEEVWV